MNIPNITTSLLTNSAYGYPSRGNARRIKPLLLACIHITGNQNNLGENAATNERNYANRNNSNGPSAHYYLNRDGSGVKAIEPTKYAAWSNGDVNTPKTNFIGYDILKGVYLDEGFNANEAFLLEIENCGYGSSYLITKAQKETIAYLLAFYSISQDMPIDRSTVFAHSDINSVTRANCPIAKAAKETFLSEIILLAEQYKKDLITAPYQAQIAALTSQVALQQEIIASLNTTIVSQQEALLDKEEDLQSCRDDYAALQEAYDLEVQESLTLEDIVKEYDEVKALWKNLHDTLNN